MQYDSPLWHELRYARITASKLHAAAHCLTFDGSLVEQVLGAKFNPTAAMERGTRLEASVRRSLQKKLKSKIRKCGFLLNKDFPLFDASPDGIADDFVVEIKCPSSNEAQKSYFAGSGNVPADKHNAQIQLQMLFAGKEKGCFCVADADFEDTQGVKEIWVSLDKPYCEEVISKAYKFWAQAIFPKLGH